MLRFAKIFLFPCMIIFFMIPSSSAQSELSEELASLMDEMDVYYLQALENSYKSLGSGSNRYFDYDMRLRARDIKEEVLVVLKPSSDHAALLKYPHIELNRFIALCATNDQEANIEVKNLSRSELKELNASWGVEARFYLKNGISKYDKARLMCLYKEGFGMVYNLNCYQNKISEGRLFVSFKDSEDELE